MRGKGDGEGEFAGSKYNDENDLKDDGSGNVDRQGEFKG